MAPPAADTQEPTEAILHAKSALPGEMKQVSVLFCDIVNSTPMTERLGPEAMRDLVSAFLKASLAEVHRYGGSAPQFTGDGFMALFGAPLTYEDHVRRALLAALAIRRVLGHGETDGREQLDLPVRIGIHTGPVVFGPVGDKLPMDDTVIGDTANFAARLQQAAEPGEILLSEATRLLAQGYVRVDPVGPLILKGRVEPIAAYRLLGVSHRRTAVDEATSARPTIFVGRDGELAVLNNILRQVEIGHGQAVGIVGEPGIGKTRLVAEFHRQLADRRMNWVEGRCLSYGTAIPYMLVLDLLRSNCRIFDTDTPEAITKKVRLGLQEVGMDAGQDSLFLLHLLGIKDVDCSTALSNPEAVKGKAFEILRQLNIKGSEQYPLVLVMENLHWIDKLSEEFLGFLSENVRGTRILLLATYRPGYRPPWIDKSYAGQIPLQPLSWADSHRVLQSVLRGEILADPVTEEIVTKADGNPFFLEELALHAGEAKKLRFDLMVPNTIHDVVMARIDRLSDDTKQLLQTAAVIGREFSLDLLRAVWKDQGPLETYLRELSHLEFVYERLETEGVVYRFRHALTREAAYGSLLERHRRTSHGAVGRALEELYRGRTAEVAELLALHFGRSNEADKAVDYAILAAERAQRRWANSEAMIHFNNALERLDTMPDTKPNRLRRIDAVVEQAEVKFALGRHTEHIKALEDIRGILNETDDPRRRAAWHYWTGFLNGLTGARLDTAIDHCREAAAIASASGLDEIDAFATSCLAQLYILAGRPRDTVEAGERALSSFESRDNRWWAGRTLGHLTLAANALGEWDLSLSYCRRLQEHGVVLEDLRLKAVGWWRMGSAYIEQGDLERGLRCCDEALGLALIPYDSAMTHAVRGYGEIKAGRFEEGISELGEAVAWFDTSQLRYNHRRFALWLAEGHLRRGDRASARLLIDQVLATSRETGYLLLEGRACWLTGDCLAAETPAAAEDHVAIAMGILERVGAQNDLAKAMVTRAMLRESAGDTATARQLLEQASAIFRRLGTVDEPPRVAAALAALDGNRSGPPSPSR